MSRLHRCLLLAGCLLPTARTAPAQEPDSVTIVAGIRYKTGGPLGWLARWVFGARNRDLWGTPVTVEAIAPEQWRGGIHLLGADTGLRMGYQYYRDSIGETWTFRALDRDLSALTPDRFREAAMSGFFQDLYSARHPGAPLVWPTLARAAGVGVTAERLVALVGDSLATPGYLEHGIDTRFRLELDDPGVAISSSALLDSLARPDPPAVDTLQYLRERLFDLYVGSWDPLPQEWLWGNRNGAWRPLPRDRDGAFARFDGLVASLAATGWAELASFEADYTGKLPVTARTRVLDRRLLTGLDPARWIPVALDMRSRLTDSVIAAAVGNLPPEYQRLNGAQLHERLRSRRDALPEAAQRYRLLVVEEAELYGTLGPDSVVVDFAADSLVRVRMPGRMDRTFHASETETVRLYLLGDVDRLLIRGSGVLGPGLVVADQGQLVLTDSSLARPYEVRRDLVLPQLEGEVEAPLVRGSRWNLVPWLDVGSDLGGLIGMGLVRTSYDPEWDPWQRRMRLRLGYASAPAAFGLEFRGEFPFRSSPWSLRIDAKASGLEILRFYGYGNETPRTEEKSFYRTDQQHLVLAPTLVIPVNRRMTAEIGPVAKIVTTGPGGDNLISELQPYGVTDKGFSQVGVQGSFQVDSRDSPVFATRGWLLRLGATAYSPLLDAEDPFGSIDGALSGAVTPLAPLTLSARLSGRASWGNYPVHEAAYLGGSRTVRSLTSQRFAGDAAVWANFDARLRLTSLPFVMRWDFGVLGIADVGRVYYEAETSSKWHPGLGGGLWAALPDRSFMGLLQVVTGPEGIRFSAGSGFIF
jgi:hypothetical protein